MTQEEQAGEREDLIQEIEAAFAGVDRVDGLSWRQSAEASLESDRWMEENCLKPEELFQGRDITWRELQKEAFEDEDDLETADETSQPFHDRDHAWQDLLDDSEWQPSRGPGRFAFLDPIGRRYYLPAAMIRSLRNPEEWEIGCSLISIHYGGYPRNPNPNLISPEKFEEEWDYFRGKWSAFNERQVRCVGRFIDYKLSVAQEAFTEFLREIGGSELDEDIVASMREAHLNPWKAASLSWREAWEGDPQNFGGTANHLA